MVVQGGWRFSGSENVDAMSAGATDNLGECAALRVRRPAATIAHVRIRQLSEFCPIRPIGAWYGAAR